MAQTEVAGRDIWLPLLLFGTMQVVGRWAGMEGWCWESEGWGRKEAKEMEEEERSGRTTSRRRWGWRWRRAWRRRRTCEERVMEVFFPWPFYLSLVRADPGARGAAALAFGFHVIVCWSLLLGSSHCPVPWNSRATEKSVTVFSSCKLPSS